MENIDASYGYFVILVFNAHSFPSSVGSNAGFWIQGLRVRIQARSKFFPTFDKSHCHKRHSSFIDWLTVYTEKQPVTCKICCVEYWWEKARKHMSRLNGRRDITEKMLKTTLNPKSINRPILLLIVFISTLAGTHLLFYHHHSGDRFRAILVFSFVWLNYTKIDFFKLCRSSL